MTTAAPRQQRGRTLSNLSRRDWHGLVLGGLASSLLPRTTRAAGIDSKVTWDIPDNIEYEYKGDDTVAEVRRCVEYCKQALG